MINESFGGFYKKNKSDATLLKLQLHQQTIDDVEHVCFIYQESILMRIKEFPEYTKDIVQEWKDFYVKSSVEEPITIPYLDYETAVLKQLHKNIDNMNIEDITEELKKY